MFPRSFSNFSDWNVWEPFSELNRLRNELNRLSSLAPSKADFPTAGVFPLANLSEDQDNYYIRAELPGLNPEDIEITAIDGNISIAGERSIPQEGEKVRYHRRERESGKFSRMIGLPGTINPDKVEASFNNGLLTVTVPKSEASKPKQIKVN